MQMLRLGNEQCGTSAGRYSDAVAELKPWLNTNPADGTSWAVLGLRVNLPSRIMTMRRFTWSVGSSLVWVEWL